jgi:glyoxylase-like metal-dependent hydrolase (beta-lactamase superfamily II)
MQILPNVYLVNGFPYRRHQNGYMVRLGHALVMIDSGDLEDAETLGLVRRNAAIWGLALEDVDYLFVTHAHFDHSSHAAALQRLGVQVVAGRDTAEAMAAGDDRCVGYAVHRTFEPCVVDRVVSDGDEIVVGGHAVRCIAAPGHAEGCIIYQIDLDGRRLWFVGDVILTGLECGSVELGWAGGPDYCRPTYLETLHRLAHMDCDCLLPGHGEPCLDHAHVLVEMAYTKAMLEWR